MDEQNRFLTGYVTREIEHHFEVKDGWRPHVKNTHHITNCYFPKGKDCLLSFHLTNGGSEFEIRREGEQVFTFPLSPEMQEKLVGKAKKLLFPNNRTRLGDGCHARVRFWNDVPNGDLDKEDPEKLEAYFTIKAKNGVKNERFEFEIPLPMPMARALVGYAPDRVSKMRHDVTYKGHKWEIDEFLPPHRGTFIAEVELPSSDCKFEIPPWVGPSTKVSNIKLAQRTNLSPAIGDGITPHNFFQR